MLRIAALLWIMTAVAPILTGAFQAVVIPPSTASNAVNPHSRIRFPSSSSSSSLFESLKNSDSQELDQDEQPASQKKKKKKKKGYTINPNLVGSISSDGIVTNHQLPTRSRPQSSTLGVPSRKKPNASIRSTATTTKPIMSKKDRQRTANGAIDSSRQSRIGDPEREEVQVVEAKRGSKAVTIVRYANDT